MIPPPRLGFGYIEIEIRAHLALGCYDVVVQNTFKGTKLIYKIGFHIFTKKGI